MILKTVKNESQINFKIQLKMIKKVKVRNQYVCRKEILYTPMLHFEKKKRSNHLTNQ